MRGDAMTKKHNLVRMLCLLLSLILMIMAGWIVGVSSAAEKSAETRIEGFSAPLLNGDLWQGMDQNSKVAFIWGAGHVVAIEKELAVRYPELKVENFSAKVAEGIVGVPMNDIVAQVDAFYKANPAKLNVPVMRVIWDSLIKPKLKTGIAGRPLQK